MFVMIFDALLEMLEGAVEWMGRRKERKEGE